MHRVTLVACTCQRRKLTWVKLVDAHSKVIWDDVIVRGNCAENDPQLSDAGRAGEDNIYFSFAS